MAPMASSAGPGPGAEEMQLPNTQVGRVIGRSGDTINRLQVESGCRIQVAQDTGQPSRLCTLTGSPEAIEKAKQLIIDIVNDGMARDGVVPGGVTTEGGDQKTVTMDIPANKVGAVIGRSGETIRLMQEKSGARLDMIQVGGGHPAAIARDGLAAGSLAPRAGLAAIWPGCPPMWSHRPSAV